MKDCKKILIVRTDRLGDAILSTPVIENIRLAYPRAHIAFMCQPYTKDVLLGNPFLDEVIVYDKAGKEKSFFKTVLFSLRLRRAGFDCAIILHPTNRVHMIAFLAAIPLRIGWRRKMSFLLTSKIEHRKQEGRRHESEYTLDLIRALGIVVITGRTFFPLRPSAKLKVEQILSGNDVGEAEKLIVIHPLASCRSKLWSQENFSLLVQNIKKAVVCRVAVVSDALEKDLCKKIISENDVIDLRGQLSIAELGALIDRADLFISNDSGPVHIAASLGRPVIALFGRNNPGLSPQRWRPLGGNSFYFHKPADCKECLAHDCPKDFACLSNIDPREVADKALAMLKDFSRSCR